MSRLSTIVDIWFLTLSFGAELAQLANLLRLI